MRRTHMFSILSAVILGTGCLAWRQAFREGGCEMNTRIPEMNPKLESCLRALTWPGGVCPWSPWEKGLRAAHGLQVALLIQPPLRPEGPTKTQGQEVELPSPSPHLLS